jgi:hypothetical protein
VVAGGCKSRTSLWLCTTLHPALCGMPARMTSQQQSPAICHGKVLVHVQWRETRTIGDKIKELKKELPAKDSEGKQPSSPLDGEIKAMENVRVCTPYW